MEFQAQSSKLIFKRQRHVSTFKDAFNSLPNDKILEWSILKAFADDKINVTEKLKYVLERVENIVENRRKCW